MTCSQVWYSDLSRWKGSFCWRAKLHEQIKKPVFLIHWEDENVEVTEGLNHSPFEFPGSRGSFLDKEHLKNPLWWKKPMCAKALLKGHTHHGFHQAFPLIRLPNVTINTGFLSQETKYKLDPKERFLTGSCENSSMNSYIWKKLTLEIAVMWGKSSISKFRMSHFGFVNANDKNLYLWVGSLMK